jgi:hypothetical protein
MKDLRTEVYQTIYEQPIYPKILYLDRAPYNHAVFRREVIECQILGSARVDAEGGWARHALSQRLLVRGARSSTGSERCPLRQSRI